jgi:DNA-binding transcriptional MerR regulator
MTDNADNDRVYMREIERELDRDRSTIRTWERMGWLPSSLAFHRTENGWRYWTRGQLDEAKAWMASRNPGRTRPRAAA